VRGEALAGPADAVRRRIARHLRAGGIATAGLEARLLLRDALGCDEVDLLAGRAPAVDGRMAERLAEHVARRLAHEPIAYILGEREFWSLPLRVTRDVLIPRPDSETLIEAAIATWPGGRQACRVLDLGTGTGCLIAALLSEWPMAKGLAIDVSAAALTLARDNLDRLGLGDRCHFVLSDWDSALGDARFDVILCNPPYIGLYEAPTLPCEVRGFEPPLALFGGSDGLAAYRRVLPACRRLLDSDGRAFIEIAAERLTPLIPLIGAAGLKVVDVKDDLCGKPRCIVLAA
jgi:release factor glutamine methyltransferase